MSAGIATIILSQRHLESLTRDVARQVRCANSSVMAGLVPAISIPDALSRIEIRGTRPGMTVHSGTAGQTLTWLIEGLAQGIPQYLLRRRRVFSAGMAFLCGKPKKSGASLSPREKIYPCRYVWSA